MNAAYELAKLFRERDNPRMFSVITGTIISLPDIKVAVGDKLMLGRDMLSSTVDIMTQDSHGNYTWQGKNVYMLPIGNDNRQQRFLIIGGDTLGN